jgi:hypothetical protein
MATATAAASLQLLLFARITASTPVCTAPAAAPAAFAASAAEWLLFMLV